MAGGVELTKEREARTDIMAGLVVRAAARECRSRLPPWHRYRHRLPQQRRALSWNSGYHRAAQFGDRKQSARPRCPSCRMRSFERKLAETLFGDAYRDYTYDSQACRAMFPPPNSTHRPGCPPRPGVHASVSIRAAPSAHPSNVWARLPPARSHPDAAPSAGPEPPRDVLRRGRRGGPHGRRRARMGRA